MSENIKCRMLRQWEEVIGCLKHVKVDLEKETVILFVLSHGSPIEISVPYGTINYAALIDCRIGILRTDDPRRPYLVRVMMDRDSGSHRRGV